ncbi:MAG: hypothetical protein JWR50_3989 [Mucilaginibacter sp.]|nr:hypothetical protein [Mucilaginibacter sp.]
MIRTFCWDHSVRPNIAQVLAGRTEKKAGCQAGLFAIALRLAPDVVSPVTYTPPYTLPLGGNRTIPAPYLFFLIFCQHNDLIADRRYAFFTI